MENLNTITDRTSREVTSRYANILLDHWFKRSFGTEINKRLMILFLQEIIPEAHVKDITYNNKEHLNPFPEDRGIVVDVEAVSVDGARFVVEVQLAPQDYFMERALFYSSFAIQEQIMKEAPKKRKEKGKGRKMERDGDAAMEEGNKEGRAGMDSYDFMPVYFIGLMDFSLHKNDKEKFLYDYILTEKGTGETMTDRIQFRFLELTKVKSINKESTNLEKLCYALHNMKALKSKPPEMTADIFTLLFDSAEISKFTSEEKIKYQLDMTTERDIRNQLAYSRQKGREEAMVAMADKMLEKGFPPEEIMELTGLDVKKIESLK